MRSIRNGVFETNSSSTHSLSIRKSDKGLYPKTSLVVEEDNRIHVLLGEYGWEYEKYNRPIEKLAYLCTMCLETDGRWAESVEKFYECDGFKMINDAIAEYCNCDGIQIDSELTYEYERVSSETAYIDHQSCEDYYSVKSYLDDYGVGVVEFVFDSSVTVITDNDNH